MGKVSRWRTDKSKAVALEPVASHPNCTILIKFHHLLSEVKRRDFVLWTQELGLRGFSKAGHPGLVLVHGTLDNISTFISRVREHRWNTMELRHAERGPLIPEERIFEEIADCNNVDPAVAWCSQNPAFAAFWRRSLTSPIPNPKKYSLPLDTEGVTCGLLEEWWKDMRPPEYRAYEEQVTALSLPMFDS